MNKIVDWLNRMAERHGERVDFDPHLLKDKLALLIPWTPLKPGGTNFATHRLWKRKPNQLVFAISFGGLAFCLTFLISGLIIVGISSLFLPRDADGFSMMIPLLVGVLFAAVGAGMLYFMARPRVFDRDLGYYWCGWRQPFRFSQDKMGVSCVSLDHVHALQIISECCGSDSVYHSYELNLVLDNGDRINVLDHGMINLIQEESAELSLFLGVPVWDASRLAKNPSSLIK